MTYQLPLDRLKAACIQRLNEQLASMALADYEDCRRSIEQAKTHDEARRALLDGAGVEVKA